MNELNYFEYFEQLVSLMNEEDLLRFRKRCQMKNMIVLGTMLALEFERREEPDAAA